MKISFKKRMAYFLMLVLCLGGISYQGESVKADDAIAFTIGTYSGASVPAGSELYVSFTINVSGNLFFSVTTGDTAKNFTYSILDLNKSQFVANNQQVLSSSSKWYYSDEDGYYICRFSHNMSAGNYKISLVFEEPVSQLKIGGLLYPGETSNTGQTPANKEKPSLDYTSLTITKGFKDKVSVINTGGAKLTFTSSNNSIATVASNGVVTAKKKGKATITVTTSTGYKLSCKVKVVDNVYSKKKTALSKVKKGDFTVNVYKVSYDKKGNLILKTRLLNKCGSQVQYIKNFKIILKNGNGKKIGTYTVKKKNIKLKSGKKKDYTLKIKKSKLKLKQNQDLRFLGKPSVSGDYYIKPKYVPKKKPQSSGGSTKQTSQPAVRAKKTITVISAH